MLLHLSTRQLNLYYLQEDSNGFNVFFFLLFIFHMVFCFIFILFCYVSFVLKRQVSVTFYTWFRWLLVLL